MILGKILHSPLAAGILLIVTSFTAIILCNTSAEPFYLHLVHSSLAGYPIEKIVNDILMSVFFLLVGLEIKREFLTGQLSSWGQRILPGAAAVGGMLVPALFYLALNIHSPESVKGWAIPSATDIAFSLGILSMLGNKVPASLKVFLAALAIIDDLGAVLIIAFFYTAKINVLMLTLAGLSLTCLIAINRLRVKAILPYLIIGAFLWYFVYESGVHATIAGVLLALCIPHSENNISPLTRLEIKLTPWVGFLIIPIFGFVNAGVSVLNISVEQVISAVPLGIGLGLFLGKQIGITLIALILIKSGLVRLPAGANSMQFYGVAILCGIGFTMSLFIGGLAFPGKELLQEEVKIGVLAGSVLSAIVGVLVLNFAHKASE